MPPPVGLRISSASKLVAISLAGSLQVGRDRGAIVNVPLSFVQSADHTPEAPLRDALTRAMSGGAANQSGQGPSLRSTAFMADCTDSFQKNFRIRRPGRPCIIYILLNQRFPHLRRCADMVPCLSSLIRGGEVTIVLEACHRFENPCRRGRI